MSCSSKLIEPEERASREPLTCSQDGQKLWVTQGPTYLWLASEVGWEQSCVTEPSGIWHYLWEDSVKTGVNYTTLDWYCGKLLSVGKIFTHLVTGSVRSEAFCMRSKGDTQEGKMECFEHSPPVMDISTWSLSFIEVHTTPWSCTLGGVEGHRMMVAVGDGYSLQKPPLPCDAQKKSGKKSSLKKLVPSTMSRFLRKTMSWERCLDFLDVFLSNYNVCLLSDASFPPCS